LQNLKVLQYLLQNLKVLQYLLQNFQVLQKLLQNFQVLRKILQKFSSIAKVLQFFSSIVKSIAKYESIAKSIAAFKCITSCGILYLILIGDNYFYIIHLTLIYLHFFVINSLWWIKLFPYVICWIQKLCLLYNFFYEYNYIKLKYYLKMLIDQCMMWCFFCSMSWYGVVWNSVVFCSMLKVYFNAKYCSVS